MAKDDRYKIRLFDRATVRQRRREAAASAKNGLPIPRSVAGLARNSTNEDSLIDTNILVF